MAWKGKNSLYRFHIEDPIMFRSPFGDDRAWARNSLSNDYSSTAYWYRAEPHAPFPCAHGGRLPRPD
jgi:hypothetical protein